MGKDQVTVVYMFYFVDSLEPTGRTSLIRSCLDIGGRAISLISRDRITHVLVAVKLDAGIIYCNWNPKRGTHWYNTPPKLIPDRVVFENGELDIDQLDPTLPLGEQSTWWKILLWYLTGFPRDTMSCAMIVHRLREMMSRKTKARSPGGIYRELRKSTVDQPRATGPIDP